MAIVLPRQAQKAQDKDPAILLLLASTKCGKTSSCLQLPNSLLIDLEDGSRYYDGVALNLKQESIKTNKGMGSLLLETANAIREANQQNGAPIYDFITIDTLTIIQEIARVKATIDYKATLQGKNFNGKDIARELPKGAGWDFVSSAFNELINPFKGLPGKCLILLAHKKLKSVEKESGEIEINDIELTGKMKLIATSQADSIGHLYRSRKDTNNNILCFKKDEGDTIWGSRSPHLQNKSFIFSTYNKKTGELKTNWDLVFTSLRNKSTPVMQEVEDEDITPVVTINGKQPKTEPIPH